MPIYVIYYIYNDGTLVSSYDSMGMHVCVYLFEHVNA